MGENGRLAVSREALEAWKKLVASLLTAAIHEGSGWSLTVSRSMAATAPAFYQAWLDRTLLPADADSTIYPVNQRLIVVEATYMLPASALAATAEAATISHHSDEYSKLCDTAMALSY